MGTDRRNPVSMCLHIGPMGIACYLDAEHRGPHLGIDTRWPVMSNGHPVHREVAWCDG